MVWWHEGINLMRWALRAGVRLWLGAQVSPCLDGAFVWFRFRSGPGFDEIPPGASLVYGFRWRWARIGCLRV